MIKLRVHHLFCSALYAGKGYSEKFCGNMEQIVKWLWEKPTLTEERKERQLELVAQPDCICLECPNLTEEGCLLDDNNVVSKDIRLAQSLQLKTGHIYSVSEVLHQTAAHLTKEIFEASCKKCEWYQAGLCSYEELAGKYDV